MPRTSGEIAEMVLGYLLEIHSGECSLDEARVAQEYEVDPNMSEILSGLRLLSEDLSFREGEQQRTQQDLEALTAELSTPILRIWGGVLLVPVIGTIDSDRAADIMERLLAAVVKHQARFVIVDLTGVSIVDTATADNFLRIIEATKLLGAKAIIAGIQPMVSVTLTTIGVGLAGVTTTRDTEEALRRCIEETGTALRPTKSARGPDGRPAPARR